MASGYTKISHNLFKFLYSSDLNGSELKVLLFLVRYTKGFGRDSVSAAYTFIANGTNLSETSVKRAIKKLIKKGYITIEREHCGSAAQLVKIIWSNLTTSYGQKCTHHMVNSDHTNVVNSDHQDNKTKYNSKENIYRADAPILPKMLEGKSFDEMNDYETEMYNRWKAEVEEWEENN